MDVFETLRQMQKKARISSVIFFLFVVATFVVFYKWDIWGLIVIIPAGISFLFMFRAGKTYTAYFKENVVKGILQEVFTDLSFSPNQGIPSSVVFGTHMMKEGNRYESNDLITGRYNGVGFSQSDVTIQEESTDSDGNTSTTTIFRGRWMIFDFNKTFRCDMQAISTGFYASKRKGGLFARKEDKLNRIQFENETFNKAFHVYAQNQEEAFYIMTPHMMESLMNLKNGLKAPIMLMFVGGILHIAVHNNRDAFEAKVFGKLDPERERERILGDIRVITDFVDQMNLERDIYKS